ncbi:diaminobutyrate acetyltransferase [Pontiella agarivorans]|uniref:L-2,4-diaminobutyric acid acetyltransferase n=1 Tax=Pontiella agarivorans TaxID=3038953 RepID=A0ABU5MTW9_9BACT|nr:diaminobutyrate acetyltransferase [Pontiella agarivorans]MDZ8117654.1 diaminobutyrate acetyltransferase [Pontiella agarivorans]
MQKTTKIDFYPPVSTDGYALHRLVAACPPLDPNSAYCNLLQCSHFNETAICAKEQGNLVGFISGYLIPDRPDTLFVWQVAVAESARGQGLAGRMLIALLERPACRNVRFLETTITPSNGASQAVFTKLAAVLEVPVNVSAGFDRNTHFEGAHESEELWRIGPITQKQSEEK